MGVYGFRGPGYVPSTQPRRLDLSKLSSPTTVGVNTEASKTPQNRGFTTVHGMGSQARMAGLRSPLRHSVAPRRSSASSPSLNIIGRGHGGSWGRVARLEGFSRRGGTPAAARILGSGSGWALGTPQWPYSTDIGNGACARRAIGQRRIAWQRRQSHSGVCEKLGR